VTVEEGSGEGRASPAEPVTARGNSRRKIDCARPIKGLHVVHQESSIVVIRERGLGEDLEGGNDGAALEAEPYDNSMSRLIRNPRRRGAVSSKHREHSKSIKTSRSTSGTRASLSTQL
jgi:hypothetical protein